MHPDRTSDEYPHLGFVQHRYANWQCPTWRVAIQPGDLRGYAGILNLQSSSLTINNDANIHNTGVINVSGDLTVGGTPIVQSNAVLGGDGSVTGNVEVQGVLAPGTNAIGTLTVTGEVTLVDGTLDIEIGGTVPGVEFDTLDITGTVSLGGALDVSLIDLLGGMTLNGVTVNSDTSVRLSFGKSLSGSGAFTGRVASYGGSSITAWGNLAVGDATAVDGFYSNSQISANNHTVTFNDANDAVLDSGALVDLGAAGSGQLAAPNGLTLDFGGNIIGAGAINTPNDPFKPFINNGHVTGSGGGITTTGYVKGVGTFDNVTHSGTYSPGFSPAIVHAGSVAYEGMLHIELGGTAPGSFDQINHSGTSTLGGTLYVELIGEFLPQLDDTFEILNAMGGITVELSSFVMPELSGLYWLLDQESTTLTLSLTGAPADFNGNDWVDGSDYLIWQTGYGRESGATQSDGDSDGDGDVDDVDLAHWQLQFGKRIVGYPVGPATAVPEPSSCLLVFALLVTFAARKWGKHVFST